MNGWLMLGGRGRVYYIKFYFNIMFIYYFTYIKALNFTYLFKTILAIHDLHKEV